MMARLVVLLLVVVVCTVIRGDEEVHRHETTDGASSRVSHSSESDSSVVVEQCIDPSGQQQQKCLTTAQQPSSTLQQRQHHRDDGVEQRNDNDTEDEDEEDEKDPMLRKMPDYDFEAYVRADVSTFYREPVGTRKEYKPNFTGQGCKFINMSPERVELYWVNGADKVLNDIIQPWSAGGVACYPTNHFIHTKSGNMDHVICKFIIDPSTSVYYCNPYVAYDAHDVSSGQYQFKPLSIETLTEIDKGYYDAHIFNLKFGAAYQNFTGSPWLSMYPRDPPKHRIWRADYFGQTHSVVTNETHFQQIPMNHDMVIGGDKNKLTINAMGKDIDPLSNYRKPGVLNMTLKVVSCAPRAFEIQNFLSDVEVDHLLNIVHTKYQLKRSEVGEGRLSTTRTSRTTWIPRNTDPVVNAIYRRVADALRLDEALLRPRLDGELDEERERILRKRAIHEDLQVVHYNQGQEYAPHHDFGYPKAGQPNSPSRSINFCMYLNNVPSGGATSFPRWRNGETSSELQVQPEMGKAMIFYMINPDGNLDDLTHHAGMPVQDGEKWFTNLWIYDPVRL